jgi:hypothetical protein
MKVGFNYHIIHACPNGCILFPGVHTDLDTYAKCGLTWYKDVGRTKVPIKVLCCFPLIPRLKCMFKAPVILIIMVWHNDSRSIDGLVGHVVDNKAQVHIDVMWPKFATEPCNARLGLATNVVNPFGAQSSTWSTWLVMLQIYNLPPWLVTKNFFVILALIILGKEYMKMHNINVYMAPLIKELQVLWRGVATYDVARAKGQ